MKKGEKKTALPVYKNPKRSIESRVRDLLRRMTLEEKVGQLISYCPVSQIRPDDYTDEMMIDSAKNLIDTRHIGQMGVAARHSDAEHGPHSVNVIQRYAVENTRLGIPILIQDECVHGTKSRGSTMFPQSIGLAASWDTDFMVRVADAIGKETRARGINQCYSPTLNIARDVRCGRVEETYGEDPYLLSRMGVAFITTVQNHGLAATPKHFVANFVGDGGRDSHPVYFSERILREVYFPGFKAAITEAKSKSIMIAHTELDGIPCSNNKHLIQDVLRKEWGFGGFIVPDNTDVTKNFTVHSQADSFEQSCQWCIEAGLDTDMSWPPPPPIPCYEKMLVKLVKSGRVKEKFVNESVARVLKVKFELGLFENPYVDESIAPRIAKCPEHRALALEAALKGAVLLKNDGMLPLAKPSKRKALSIALIGPSFDKTRLGGYTCEDAGAVTPFEGMRAYLPGNVKLLTAEGCKLMTEDRSGFAAAVKAAKSADYVIMFMGNSSDKVIGQPETTEGERHDRCDLDLPGQQEDLILEVVKANPNVVVVLQNGSAVTMSRWLDKVRAVLTVWYAGCECGNAIPRLLYGDFNPAGRLPLTFPRTTGQCPLYYNPRPHGRVPDYVDCRGKVEQFAFGFGLSYTEFKYSALKLEKTGKGRTVKVKVSCRVANAGARDGEEVVQLYIRDCYGYVTRPLKELKGFKRVFLAAGKSKKVEFELDFEALGMWDEKMRFVLDPGDFKIMVGSSSDDIRLEKKIFVE